MKRTREQTSILLLAAQCSLHLAGDDPTVSEVDMQGCTEAGLVAIEEVAKGIQKHSPRTAQFLGASVAAEHRRRLETLTTDSVRSIEMATLSGDELGSAIQALTFASWVATEATAVRVLRRLVLPLMVEARTRLALEG